MNRILISALLIISAVAFYCAEPPLEEIMWEDNLETTLAAAQPVLVDFWKDG